MIDRPRVILLIKGGRILLWKGKGSPPYAGMVLLPSRTNPKIKRWQYPPGFSPSEQRKKLRARRAARRVEAEKRKKRIAEIDSKPVQERYRAYAAAHGRTPGEQSVTDGGKTHHFIAWIQKELAAWRSSSDHTRATMTKDDHKAFSAWLVERHMPSEAEPETQAKPEASGLQYGDRVRDKDGSVEGILRGGDFGSGRVQVEGDSGVRHWRSLDDLELVSKPAPEPEPEVQPEPEPKGDDEGEPTITERDTFRMGRAQLRELIEAGGPDAKVAQGEIDRRAARRRAKGKDPLPEAGAKRRRTPGGEPRQKRQAQRTRRAPRAWNAKEHAESLDRSLSAANATRLATQARAKGEKLIERGNAAQYYGNENTNRRSRMANSRRERGQAQAAWGQRLINLADRIEDGSFHPSEFDLAYVKDPSTADSVAARARYRDQYSGEARPIAVDHRTTVRLPGEYRFNRGPKSPAEEQAKVKWDRLHKRLERLVTGVARHDSQYDGYRVSPTPELAEKLGALLRQMKPLAKEFKAQRWHWAPSVYGFEDAPKLMQQQLAVGHTHGGSVPEILSRVDRFNAATKGGAAPVSVSKWSPPDRTRTSDDMSRRAYAAELERGRFKDPAHKRIEGFFPTPYPEVAEGIERLQVEPGMSVLEPSAGTGSMADLLPEGAHVTTAEVSSSLRDVLREKGYTPAANFRDVGGQFDRVIMNPPFERGQDMAHVMEVFRDRLKPGGRLVAVVSSGAMRNTRAAHKEFQQFVSEHRAEEDRDIDPKLWKRSGTQVGTVMITLEKPEELGKSSQERVSAKIRALMNEGKPQEQAVAIALSMERDGRLTEGGGYIPTRKAEAGETFRLTPGPQMRRILRGIDRMMGRESLGEDEVLTKAVIIGGRLYLLEKGKRYPVGEIRKRSGGYYQKLSDKPKHVWGRVGGPKGGKYRPKRRARRHKTHKISHRDHPEEGKEVDTVFERGQFALHKEIRGSGSDRRVMWTAVHKPSGMRLPKSFTGSRAAAQARAYVDHMDEYVDHIGSETNFEQVPHKDHLDHMEKVHNAFGDSSATEELEVPEPSEEYNRKLREMRIERAKTRTSSRGDFEVVYIPDEDRHGLRKKGSDRWIMRSRDRGTLELEAQKRDDKAREKARAIERGGELPSGTEVSKKLRQLSRVAMRKEGFPGIDTLRNDVGIGGTVFWRGNERAELVRKIAAVVKKTRKTKKAHGNKARTTLAEMDRLVDAGDWHPSKGAPGVHHDELAWLAEPVSDQSPQEIAEAMVSSNEERLKGIYEQTSHQLNIGLNEVALGNIEKAREALARAEFEQKGMASQPLMNQNTQLRTAIRRAEDAERVKAEAERKKTEAAATRARKKARPPEPVAASTTPSGAELDERGRPLPKDGQHAIQNRSDPEGHEYVQTKGQHGDFLLHNPTKGEWVITHAPSGLKAATFKTKHGATVYAKYMDRNSGSDTQTRFGTAPEGEIAQAIGDAFAEFMRTNMPTSQYGVFSIGAGSPTEVKRRGTTPGDVHTVVHRGNPTRYSGGPKQYHNPKHEEVTTAYRRGDWATHHDLGARGSRRYRITHVPTGERMVGAHTKADAERITRDMHKELGDTGSGLQRGAHVERGHEHSRTFMNAHSAAQHKIHMKKIENARKREARKAVTAATIAAIVPESLEGDAHTLEEDESLRKARKGREFLRKAFGGKVRPVPLRDDGRKPRVIIEVARDGTVRGYRR